MCILCGVHLFIHDVHFNASTLGTSDFVAQVFGTGKFSIGKIVFWLKLFLNMLI
jgi:hypothetical protein